jgi:hypothetical protein
MIAVNIDTLIHNLETGKTHIEYDGDLKYTSKTIYITEA